MPRTWKATFYSREELAAMTPEEREAAREAHRPLAYVRPDELPPAFVERTRAEATRRIEEREARDHREAS